MSVNLSQNYAVSDASIEILVMLFVSFLLGFILAWFIRNIGEDDMSTDFNTIDTLETKRDNLKLIEGVGPKIEEILNQAQIYTFEDIYSAEIASLEAILTTADLSYQLHSPNTWPDQARLAARGKWAELKEYQDILLAGRQK